MYKKIIAISLFFLIETLSYSQSLSFGGGLEYNATTENFGANLRGYYNIGTEICFGPELSYSFPVTERIGDFEEEKSVFEVNINGHYIFELFEERLGVYPLLGINYTTEYAEFTNLINGEKEQENESFWGANIGGGFHIPIKNFAPFFEYHYITGQLGESVFTVGVLYNFNKKSKAPEKI